MLKRIANSISAKTALSITVVAITFLSILFFISIRTQKESLIDEVKLAQSRLQRMASLVIWTPMTEGNDALTRKMFQEISHEFKRIRVYLCDFNGDITYSTEKTAEAKHVNAYFQNSNIPGIITQALKKTGSYGELIEDAAHPTFIEVRSIPNQPECYHCHGKTQPILGAMIVTSDIASSFSTIASFRNTVGLVSLAMLAGLIFVVLVVLKKVILSRILSIANNTTLVSAGDLNVQFDQSGHDELSCLSQDLSVMISKIKDQMQYQEGVLAGISVPFFVADNSLTIVHPNQHMLELLGKPQNQVQGRHVTEAVYGARREHSVSQEVLDQKTTKTGRLTLSKAAETLLVNYTISPLFDSNYRLVGLICILIDITQDERSKEMIETQQKKILSIAARVSKLAISVSEENKLILGRVDDVKSNMFDVSGRTDQVATAMEQMNATVLQVSKNATTTSHAADTAKQAAIAGGKVIDRTISDIVEGCDHKQSTLELPGQPLPADHRHWPHHRDHQRHRRPDQPAGLERRHRGRQSRRSRSRLCRCGRRGSQARRKNHAGHQGG